MALTEIEFLKARVAEDEAVAKAVIPVGRPLEDGAARWSVVGQTVGDASGYIVAYSVEGEYPRRHIARHDPARVLAECEAKRQIIKLHESWPVLVEMPIDLSPETALTSQSTVFRVSKQIAWMTDREYRKRFGDEPPTAPMIHALAAVYAAHPDYLPEWHHELDDLE